MFPRFILSETGALPELLPAERSQCGLRCNLQSMDFRGCENLAGSVLTWLVFPNHALTRAGAKSHGRARR
jgi:hypothetical protein